MKPTDNLKSAPFKVDRLGHHCSFRGGIGFAKHLQGERSGDFRFIKVSDMNLFGNETCIRYSNNWISEATAKSLVGKPFPPGTTVFAKVGAALLLNRRRKLVEPTFIDNNMMGATPLHGTDENYLFYKLSSLDLGRLCQVGAIPSVNQGDLSAIKIFFHPLPEQRKIAEILGACDEAIEAQQKVIELKEKRLKGWMQKLLTGKVRFPQFADEPWKEVAIGELVTPIKRKNSTGNKNVLTSSGKYGLVTQTDYFNKSVAGVNLANYFLLKKGEFAYNRSSSKGYPYGAIKRLDSCDAGVLSTLCICFSIKEIGSVNSDFFKHFFEAGILNSGLRAVCQEGARAHGLLNIIKSDFYGLKLKIPSFEEQLLIGNFLSTLVTEANLEKEKLSQLKLQKKSLMQKLLTGKVRVKVDGAVEDSR